MKHLPSALQVVSSQLLVWATLFNLLISIQYVSAQNCNGGLVTNGSFETVLTGTKCNQVTSGPPVLIIFPDAIYNGCVPNWFAANGTPSLFVEVNGIQASEGNNFMLLAHIAVPGGACDEPIYQNIGVTAGNSYSLSFDCINTFPTASGNIAIYLANNIQNLNQSGTPCLAINPSWEKIATVGVDNSTWNNFSTTFIPINPDNNQLLLVAEETNNLNVANFGIDNISVQCISDLNSNISNVTYLGGGDYLIESESIPPSGSTNYATSWCWDFGDGTTGGGTSTFFHNYQTNGVFEVSLKVVDNNGCVSYATTTIQHNDCNGADVSEIIEGDIEWTGINKVIERDIIIAPLSKLTINTCLLTMKATTKIVVMRGARLDIINQSVLTPFCPGIAWEGILVWGGGPHVGLNIDQLTASSPGVLKVIDSGLLGMNRGMQAQRWWWDSRNEGIYNALMLTGSGGTTIPSFRGGLIQADNSYFYDNRLSAEFHQFNGLNQSYFKDCIFSTIGTSSINEGVNVWGTGGISFNNCQFKDIGSIGITALDAPISVMKSTFEDNTFGIWLSHIGMATYGETRIGNGLDAQKNTFTDNAIGVDAWAIEELKVKRNDFTSQSDVTSIRVRSVSSYAIENNNINQSGYGIKLSQNAQLIEQDIVCNQFNNVGEGINVRDDCSGMVFNNNTFNVKPNGIGVHITYMGNVESSIFPFQGTSGDPAFNLFSENQQFIDIRHFHESNQFVYFPPSLPLSPITESKLTPDCPYDDLTCGSNNNYFLNAPPSPGIEDPNCIKVDGFCGEMPCYDSLLYRKNWLKNQIDLGQNVYLPELKRIERTINTVKLRLVEKWINEDNIQSISDLLQSSEIVQDKKMLFGAYLALSMYSNANIVLQSINDSDFFKVENVYLKYAQATLAEYTPTFQEITDLLIIAQNPNSLSQGHAIGLLKLLRVPYTETLEKEELDYSKNEARNSAPEFVEKTSNVVFFPNPTNEFVDFIFKTPVENIVFIDIFGREVKRILSFDSVINTRVYVGNLSDGYYQVVSKSNAESVPLGKLCIKH